MHLPGEVSVLQRKFVTRIASGMVPPDPGKARARMWSSCGALSDVAASTENMGQKWRVFMRLASGPLHSAAFMGIVDRIEELTHRSDRALLLSQSA